MQKHLQRQLQVWFKKVFQYQTLSVYYLSIGVANGNLNQSKLNDQDGANA